MPEYPEESFLLRPSSPSPTLYDSSQLWPLLLTQFLLYRLQQRLHPRRHILLVEPRTMRTRRLNPPLRNDPRPCEADLKHSATPILLLLQQLQHALRHIPGLQRIRLLETILRDLIRGEQRRLHQPRTYRGDFDARHALRRGH